MTADKRTVYIEFADGRAPVVARQNAQGTWTHTGAWCDVCHEFIAPDDEAEFRLEPEPYESRDKAASIRDTGVGFTLGGARVHAYHRRCIPDDMR